MNHYPNTLFETAEQRAEREKYEAERKAFFESIPKRAEETLIVGQSSESLVEELRKQLSELGVLRTLDQQRIAALEAELAQARAAIAELRAMEQNTADLHHKTHDELVAARAECERLRAELSNIANAKRFDKTVFEGGDSEFSDWAQSRARFTLDAARKEGT